MEVRIGVAEHTLLQVGPVSFNQEEIVVKQCWSTLVTRPSCPESGYKKAMLDPSRLRTDCLSRGRVFRTVDRMNLRI